MVAGNISTKSPRCIKIPTFQKLPIQKTLLLCIGKRMEAHWGPNLTIP